MTDEPLWSIGDLSAFLGVPVQTIYRWRTVGYGPPAIKIGRHLKWIPRVVREWLERHRDDWEDLPPTG